MLEPISIFPTREGFNPERSYVDMIEGFVKLALVEKFIKLVASTTVVFLHIYD
jgi:hypothetical protein